MRPTRRCQGLAAAAGFLAISAILWNRMILLLAGAGIGAWLLVHQIAFVRAAPRAINGLSVTQTLDRERAMVDEAVSLRLDISLDQPSELVLEGELNPPAAATGSTRSSQTVRLAAGATGGKTSTTIACPVAGTYQCDKPTVRLIDSSGLFTDSLAYGPSAELTVEPHRPTDIHIGEAGNRVLPDINDTDSRHVEVSLDPGGLREYQPGDRADRIDWFASARLNQMYTREFDAERIVRNVMIIDARWQVRRSTGQQQKLDYLCQGAISLIGQFSERRHAVGLVVIGGDGDIARQREPRATRTQYVALRQELSDLMGSVPSGSMTNRTRNRLASKHTFQQLLAADTSAFGQRLVPYFMDSEATVETQDVSPLVRAVRGPFSSGSGDGMRRAVIFTDDTDISEVRRAVRAAKRTYHQVVLFIAPDVLFDPGRGTQTEPISDRYAEFEEFRRGLHRLPNVHAYEVAPTNRVGTAIAAAGDQG